MTGTIIIVIVSLLSLFLSSCQSSETNKWTPPKFVKEWEIKEIKPGPHQIISMAANKNGVYVLVKALEIKYSPPPKITKKVNEMTEKEKETFLYQYNKFFSASAILDMTKEEKNELVEFIMNHFISPREAKEITNEEKDFIINFLIKAKENHESEINKKLFKERLQKEGKDKYIDDLLEYFRTAIKEEINHFRIEQYDFEGNFIKQWLEDEIVFKEPIKVLSDIFGNISIVDYGINEVIKFDSTGDLKKKWKLLPGEPVEGAMFRGVTMTENGHLLVIGEGDLFITPKLFEYDGNGRLIRSQELKSRIRAYIKLLKNLIPLEAKIERISDIAADNGGNIYFLVFKNIEERPTIKRLSPTWKEKREFKLILKEGFDAPRNKIYEKYFNKFDSTQWSWLENGPGFYFPSSVFIDGKYLFVSFLGLKPFGIIDAAIYDTKGRIMGYWKQASRCQMEWYKALDPNVEIVDSGLWIAKYGSSIFVARTMEIRAGAFYTKNIIQKYNY